MKKLLLILAALSFFGCKEGNWGRNTENLTEEHVYEPVKVPKYELINEEIHETQSKAQITTYLVYKDTIYTEEALKTVLLDVLVNNLGRDEFAMHDAPTVIGVYLYTSLKQAETKSEWIGMLVKRPRNGIPDISLNKFKIKALQGLTDGKKSKDEIVYGKLKDYLAERGLELCSFNKKLGDIELSSIHQADKEYPDFGKKHMDYTSKLIREKRNKLKRKYSLNDSIFTSVLVFSLAYCN